MHDRGTIPPRFHYSFPTDTLYLSFSTYNIQYLSRTVIFPRAVRIFRTGLPAAVSKSWLERGNDPLFLHHFPYESYNYFFFFFPFFLRTWPSRRKEARDGELSLLGRLEDPFRGGGRMTRESLLLVSSRHSKREPRISRACDETQERHSREPLESGDLSSKRTLALLTRLSRKKEKRATFVRCDELIFFFLFSSSRRTRPSLLYTRSFDAYVVDFSSFSRRTERGGGPMHETASTSLFFTEQPIVTFKKRNCVIVVSRL